MDADKGLVFQKEERVLKNEGHRIQVILNGIRLWTVNTEI
jgi:hypothetical protein